MIFLTGAIIALSPAFAQQKVAKNTPPATIAGVSVKGLNVQQMRQRLGRVLAPKLNQTVILTDGVKKIKRTRKQLSIDLDLEGMTSGGGAGKASVPLKFKVDALQFQKILRKLAPQFSANPQNAKIVEQKGALRFVSDQSGRTVDVGASATRLASQIATQPGNRLFSLVVKKQPAKISVEALKAKTKGITGRLGQFVTAFNPSSQKRTHNIKLAASVINGNILPPGQVFSINKTLGERTQAHGYLTAPVIVEGKKIPGIGGGVSQVAGTLFNAVLVSGVRVLEYGTHAHPIAYLPLGRDATLAWNHIDLRFKNDSAVPIYLSYVVKGNRLTATLYGAKVKGQRVNLTVTSEKLGPRRIKAVLYRTIKKNGKVMKKEKVGQSDYNWKADYNE